MSATLEEWVRTKHRIESIWDTTLDWDIEALAELYTYVDGDHLADAVAQLARSPRMFAPKPPEVVALAYDLAKAERAKQPALPAQSEGLMGAEALSAFVQAHEGFTPSQWAKKQAGIDPGPPRGLSEDQGDEEGAA